MSRNLLPFDVTALDVTVAEGITLKWQNREIDSGPLSITLGAPGSSGVIDYDTGTVQVEFRARLTAPAFDEVLDILEDLGEERPSIGGFETIIRSTGSVFGDDHSLRLEGKGEITEHRLFDPADTCINILAPSH